ncbi:hypothetical protein [Saccharopolyspora sp. NPDC002686]|uniref:SHOCT domain-containing protein n=1 Tax=Saccharopolyspora sp. NPDC002686 TaxID=3154541 RepID=UPI003326D0B5
MMWGYGPGMTFLPLVWIVLIGLIGWAVFLLIPSGAGSRVQRDTPEETLARRFAADEIDEDAYHRAREALALRHRASAARAALRGRRLPLTVLVLAVAALVASVVWVVGGVGGWRAVSPGQPAAPGYGMPMMPGNGGLPSQTAPAAVANFDDARRASDEFGQQRGLHTGEVMQFSNGYYAELLDPGGHGGTEVLIDPASGAVFLEPGPAMMWNSAYGMMPAPVRGRPPTVTAEQAEQIADQWLAQNNTGLHATDPTAFPGYYTLHALRGDQIAGMLSVNARTGAVWYHSWHGQFIAMQDAPAHQS